MGMCGNCHESHPTAADVKACYAAAGKIKGEVAVQAAPAVAVSVAAPATLDFEALAKTKIRTGAVALGADENAGKDFGPPPAKSGAAPAVRRNKFGGRCARCDVWVEAEEGLLLGEKGSYRVEHEGECPEKRHVPTAAVFEAVPAGRYAVRGEDGTFDFYEVDKPDKGKYAGRTFVALLTGSVGSWRRQNLRHANATAILAKVEKAGAEESARMFGYKARVCGYCLSPLSNPQSRVAGYGGTCAGNHGFWYPTLSEAVAILKERGEDVEGEAPLSTEDVAEAFDATVVDDGGPTPAQVAHRAKVAAGTDMGYIEDESSGRCRLCGKPRPTDKNFNLGSTCYC